MRSRIILCCSCTFVSENANIALQITLYKILRFLLLKQLIGYLKVTSSLNLFHRKGSAQQSIIGLGERLNKEINYFR